MIKKGRGGETLSKRIEDTPKNVGRKEKWSLETQMKRRKGETHPIASTLNRQKRRQGELPYIINTSG